MVKGIIVNNIIEINYARKNLNEYILVTRNPEIKRKYNKFKLGFIGQVQNQNEK